MRSEAQIKKPKNELPHPEKPPLRFYDRFHNAALSWLPRKVAELCKTHHDTQAVQLRIPDSPTRTEKAPPRGAGAKFAGSAKWGLPPVPEAESISGKPTAQRRSRTVDFPSSPINRYAQRRPRSERRLWIVIWQTDSRRNFIKYLAAEVPQRGGFSMDMAVVFEWFGQIRAAEQAHEPRQREIWTRWAVLGGSP